MIDIRWGQDIDDGVVSWNACDRQLHVEEYTDSEGKQQWAWCVVMLGERDRSTGEWTEWPCGDGESSNLVAAMQYAESAYLQALANELKAEAQLTEHMAKEPIHGY